MTRIILNLLDLHGTLSSFLVSLQDFKDTDLTSNCHGLLLEAVGHPEPVSLIQKWELKHL